MYSMEQWYGSDIVYSRWYLVAVRLVDLGLFYFSIVDLIQTAAPLQSMETREKQRSSSQK